MELTKETALEWLEAIAKEESDRDRRIVEELKAALLRQAEAEGWYEEAISILELPSEIVDHEHIVDHDKDLLAQYQAKMVNICRDLGVEEVRVDVSDPAYYGDLVTERIVSLQAEAQRSSALLDPKGHVVLALLDGDALLFTNRHVPEPFVIAHGYDPETGEWAWGTYRSDLSGIYDEFRPDIYERLTIKWQRQDIIDAMENAGISGSMLDHREQNEILLALDAWKDRAIASGNETIAEEVSTLFSGRSSQSPELEALAEQAIRCAHIVDEPVGMPHRMSAPER